ncbi:MAG: DUF6090 family protein [Bacteroidota bacterium]
MGKYFKYAIGEILLVVIGILIALQINNWNENRLERIQEEELLMLLKNGIANDSRELHEVLNGIQNDVQRTTRILNHLKSKNSYPDSLYSDFAALSINRSVNFNQVAVKAFENKENLVKNNDLRYTILNLYNNLYATIESQTANQRANTRTFNRPLLKKKFIYPEDVLYKQVNGDSVPFFPIKPIDFKQLKNDVEFNNAVKTSKINLKVLESRLKDVLKAIDNVQNLIAVELK